MGLAITSVVLITLLMVLVVSLRSDKSQQEQEAVQDKSTQAVERSHDSMCNYRREHPEPSDDAGTVEYFKQLERRAPDDIVDDVAGLRKTFEEMARNPEKRANIAFANAGVNNDQSNRLWQYCQTPLAHPATDMNGQPIVR